MFSSSTHSELYALRDIYEMTDILLVNTLKLYCEYDNQDESSNEFMHPDSDHHRVQSLTDCVICVLCTKQSFRNQYFYNAKGYLIFKYRSLM